jgi:two-component system, OmpR family, phosphate regulon response regulator PhoB
MEAGARILVVEDEDDIRDLISLHLRREGYAPDPASTGQEGLRKLQAGGFDLLIVDWMLPGMSGLDLVRASRQKEGARGPGVLMVTARTEPADIVVGLEAGADDYVTKPFEVPVLLARVRALLRRARASQAQGPGSRLRAGGVSLDLEAHEASCEGEPVSLTVSEFKLLAALLQNRGRVLTRDRLIELVQGQGVSVVDRAVDTHVFGLRRKLGACGDLIQTVRGVGYRIRDGADERPAEG